MHGCFHRRVWLHVAALSSACNAAHGQCGASDGPDLLVAEIQGEVNFTGDGVFDAFSFATNALNIGSQGVLWISSTVQHPVVGQNLFKYTNRGGYSRFEQVGQSWLKHTFYSINSSAFCTCIDPDTGTLLGPGCSDPYSASRNANQARLGPKWQVNASTGVIVYPPADPAWSGPTARRLQCKVSELEPSSATVRYFAECQYLSHDDAMAGNKNNNASYREAVMTGVSPEFAVALTGTTRQGKAGIKAWKTIDPEVMETNLNIPGDGLLIVASRATHLGSGMWHYEYAVQNVNSDRSAGAFAVPLPNDDNRSMVNIGFHDVDYHDGDGSGNSNWDGANWPVVVKDRKIRWSTTPYSPAGPGEHANAIRWGTLYNFRFDCNKPPMTDEVVLNTFKTVNKYHAAAVIPGADCNGNNVADAEDIANHDSIDENSNGIPDECEQPCHAADFDHNNAVNMADLMTVLNHWGDCPGTCPPHCLGDADDSCSVNTDDVVNVMMNLGPCP